MRYAVVSSALLDLWATPAFNSGRVHQLLFGTPVQVRTLRKGYRRVIDPGGYSGWAHTNGLVEVDSTTYRGLLTARTAVVIAQRASVRADILGRPTAPFTLYYGTRLVLSSIRGGVARIVGPGQQRLYLRSGTIEKLSRRKIDGVTGRQLVGEARRFVGVPYLWGGITPNGFDCSGLIYTVCTRLGIEIPRDTKDQIKIGRPIDRGKIRTGDLLFFERHVGLAIGRNKIIHSSVAGLGVRIDSLVPGTESYRADLDRNFKEARRIVRSD